MTRLKTAGAAMLLVMHLSPVTPALAGPALPGDGMAENSRACFALKAEPGQTMTKLLLELHKEAVNPGEDPVIWAGVYGEKRGERHPGFNRDGCGADDQGRLHCGFSCDGGALRIGLAEGGVRIKPDGLILKSCGLGTDVPGGFQVNQADVGAVALMTPVDNEVCRTVMAPMEKVIEDAENGIE
jgi:hypothetical protein